MFKKFLIGFGVLAIILTITPFIAVDYWWVRMFDFPHTQLTFLTLIAIIVYFIKFDFKNIKDYAFISILIFCCFFQFTKIYPYTSFAKFEVLPSTKSIDKGLKIYTANVYQKNKKSNFLINDIKQLNPDLIVLTEVNRRWINELQDAMKSYKFKHEVPLDNTYGMAVYSKYELKDSETKFLVSDSVPSIHTKLILPTKDVIQLFAIHPTPPMPQENPMSTDRDTEMMMVAKMSLDAELPVIVLGDFNDVAWSETSKLFKQVGELLDARIGRGMFNTYNAKSFLMKWPLDHIFISEEFRVHNIEVRKSIESDHYPLYTEFTFEPDNSDMQKAEKVTSENLESVENQISEFKKNDPRNR